MRRDAYGPCFAAPSWASRTEVRSRRWCCTPRVSNYGRNIGTTVWPSSMSRRTDIACSIRSPSRSMPSPTSRATRRLRSSSRRRSPTRQSSAGRITAFPRPASIRSHRSARSNHFPRHRRPGRTSPATYWKHWRRHPGPAPMTQTGTPWTASSSGAPCTRSSPATVIRSWSDPDSACPGTAICS